MRVQSIGIGLVVFNGEHFLKELLSSILKQTYKDFIFYILDNQSTDQTQKIVQAYADKDSRVKLIIDDTQADVVTSQQKIAIDYLFSHELFMFVCDDDVYETEYLEKLVSRIKKTNASLCYSNYYHITGKGEKLAAPNSPIYSGHIPKNARNFILKRNCIPLFFGVYRTSSVKRLFKNFGRIDRHWNHENYFLISILLECKIDYVNDRLFSYRQKARPEIYVKRNWIRKKSLPELFSMLTHLFKSFFHINSIIAQSSHRVLFTKLSFYIYNFVSLLRLIASYLYYHVSSNY